MDKPKFSEEELRPQGQQVLEFGGLRFDVAFRAIGGATLRVDGKVDNEWKELLRFDDFIDVPHYHAPADAEQINFDRATLGEPLAWYIAQIRDHLPEWLEKSGFADVVPAVDMDEVVAQHRQGRQSHARLRARRLCPGARRRPPAGDRCRLGLSLR